MLNNSVKTLIFIIAYEAESTIEKVLRRIPEAILNNENEILIIDDGSKDDTFNKGLRFDNKNIKLTVLKNPKNLGYGGNQKLGYEYAIRNGFDAVAMVHGDGQYAPEKLPELLAPIESGEADVVFGSRMLDKKAALSGGMPLYKWIGNQILTKYQNLLLKSNLAEFHTGYRVYSTKTLKKIPFAKNSDVFHFDTEIIIQVLFAGDRIKEIQIPTYYGEEVCRVNGFKYAWDVFKTTLNARLFKMNLFYDPKFDISGKADYSLKLGYASSHEEALKYVADKKILDLGCGDGKFCKEVARRGGEVSGYDANCENEKGAKYSLTKWDFAQGLPSFEGDTVFMLDILEHLQNPEESLEKLRVKYENKDFIFSVPNVAFLIPRLMLLLGQFNYGNKGILDRTHTRLFTYSSIRRALEQCGYEIISIKGIPAPFPGIDSRYFPKIIGHFLSQISKPLIKLCPGLFSYQIFVHCRAKATIDTLLTNAKNHSDLLTKKLSIHDWKADSTE